MNVRTATADGAQACVQARVAREVSARGRANARVNLARGTDQVAAGSDRLREESALLQRSGLSVTRIERTLKSRQIVTDAELRALSPRLATGAERLQRRAAELRARAARQPS